MNIETEKGISCLQLFKLGRRLSINRVKLRVVLLLASVGWIILIANDIILALVQSLNPLDIARVVLYSINIALEGKGYHEVLLFHLICLTFLIRLSVSVDGRILPIDHLLKLEHGKDEYEGSDSQR